MCQRLFFLCVFFCFFFNDPATTEIYTLSLHDALPISPPPSGRTPPSPWRGTCASVRSEEHTSELQSLRHLVCRLLLEKKKKIYIKSQHCIENSPATSYPICLMTYTSKYQRPVLINTIH